MKKEHQLTKQTKNNANGNGKRKPESILRNIEPGMANAFKLKSN